MATGTDAAVAAYRGLREGSKLMHFVMKQLVVMNHMPAAEYESRRRRAGLIKRLSHLVFPRKTVTTLAATAETPSGENLPRSSRNDLITSAATGATPTQSRLLALQKKQCDVFETTYNPDRLRLGNKVLRQRLKGPTLAAYYPRKSVTFKDIQHEFKQYGLETYDDDEEYRLESLQIAKLRGKGAPKKKRTADTTKKGRGKKK